MLNRHQLAPVLVVWLFAYSACKAAGNTDIETLAIAAKHRGKEISKNDLATLYTLYRQHMQLAYQALACSGRVEASHSRGKWVALVMCYYKTHELPPESNAATAMKFRAILVRAVGEECVSSIEDHFQRPSLPERNLILAK